MTNVWPKLQDLPLTGLPSYGATTAAAHEAPLASISVTRALTDSVLSRTSTTKPVLLIGTRPFQTPRSRTSVTDQHGHVNLVGRRPTLAPPATGDGRQRGRGARTKTTGQAGGHVAVLPPWQRDDHGLQAAKSSAGNWMQHVVLENRPLGMSRSRLPGTWSP